MHACMRVCVCVCVRACVRARACVCVCVSMLWHGKHEYISVLFYISLEELHIVQNE